MARSIPKEDLHAVLEVYVDFHEENGRYPTQQEAAKQLKITQPSLRRRLLELGTKGSFVLETGVHGGGRPTPKGVEMVRSMKQGETEREPPIPGAIPLDVKDILLVPVLGAVPAGQPQPRLQEATELYGLSVTSGARPGCYMLDVTGDSMFDTPIRPGWQVVVDPETEPRNNDIVVALVNGESTLKRYVSMDGNVWLMSENHSQNYPPILLKPSDDVRIQGVVLNIQIPTKRNGSVRGV